MLHGDLLSKERIETVFVLRREDYQRDRGGVATATQPRGLSLATRSPHQARLGRLRFS